MEKHVREELAKQMDNYVDAFRTVDRLEADIAAHAATISALEQEKAQAEKLRDHASEAVRQISEALPEEDESEAKAVIVEKMSGIIGTMVFV